MITKEQVLEALHDVQDPEVHRSIVELEMVRNIDIEGSHVSVEVLLTIRGCPLRTQIEEDVETKLLSLTGVESAKVVIGHMNDEERAQFAAKLRGHGQAPQGQSQQQVAAILRPENGVKFLAVASGKGGVGKSTVTANLALALSRQGLRVGIVDADIYGFSIPSIFGVTDQRPTVIDDVIIPITVNGIKLISMHFFVPENTPVVWRGPMLGKMLRNFFNEVHWGDLDVLLLDLPPGTGDVALDVHTLLPGSPELLVTTPQPGASEVAVRAGLMAVRTNHEVIGVVENMAYYECKSCSERDYIFGQGGGERVAQALKSELLVEVPIASLQHQQTSLFHEGSAQAKAYALLAEKVQEKLQLKTTAAV